MATAPVAVGTPARVDAPSAESPAPRVLNAGQLAKLARARAAIERSRSDGTLAAFRAPEPVLDPPLPPEVAEAQKLERLAQQAPVPYVPESDAPTAGEVR
jgi:hypothetical protein